MARRRRGCVCPAASRAQSWFSASTNSGGKPAGLEVGIIVPVLQADAHGLAAGLLLEEGRDRADQFWRAGAFIHQAEELDGDFSFVEDSGRSFSPPL